MKADAIFASSDVRPRPYPAEMGGLTSLRFFAAIWVVAMHYSWWAPTHPNGVPIVDQGGMAVDFFFILSGFILAHAHAAESRRGAVRIRPFLIKRLARIYPMHLATLCFYLALVIGAAIASVRLPNPGRYGFGEFVANLLLVHAWQFRDAGSWNYPSWSISAEWFAYLLFPLIARAIVRGTNRTSPWHPLIASAALLVLFWVLSPLLLACDFYDLHSNFGIVRILPEFLIGVSLYRVGSERDLGMLAVPGLSLLLLLLIGLLAFLDLRSAMIPLFVLLIAAIAEQARAGHEGLLTARGWVYLGEISYSIYMIHVPVSTLLLAGGRIATHGTPAWLWLAGIAVVVPVAMTTHRLIEMPGRRLMLRLLGTR